MFDLFKRDGTEERRSWSERLRAGLDATRQRFAAPLAVLVGRKELSEEALEELETALLAADVGVPATGRLLADLRARWQRAGPQAEPRELLKASLTALLSPLEKDRKSTRLNSSHVEISYAVFCLKKKKKKHEDQ